MVKVENHTIEFKQSWHDEYRKLLLHSQIQGGTIYIGYNDRRVTPAPSWRNFWLILAGHRQQLESQMGDIRQSGRASGARKGSPKFAEESIEAQMTDN